MRRKAVVLAVFCLLVYAGGAHAVTLQQGWYAQVRSVDVYIYTPPYGDVVLSGGASFTTQPGAYGPFQVTKDPYGDNSCRTVTVPATMYGVAPGTSVELPLMTGYNSVAYLYVWWQSDYDASCMRLQLIRRDPQTGYVALLWEQETSGPLMHEDCMAFDAETAGLAFRVLAVPEPHGAMALFMGVLACGLPAVARRQAR